MPRRLGSVQGMHMKTRLANILEKMPLVLLASAAALTVFAGGMLVGAYQVFPYRIIADGLKTGLTLLDAPENEALPNLTGFSEVPPENAAANRIRFMAGTTLHGPLLWYGGRFQFLDLCPGNGCLAVEYTDTGEVAHAWPYRPAELERAAQASTVEEFHYELSPTFSFARDMYPAGISVYPNGDLLVTFHSVQAFPYQGGVARIDSDGQPVWFRRDFSHHWPQLLDDGTSLVTGLLIADEDISFEIAKGWSVTVNCHYDRPYLDTVTVIDGQGRLLERVNLADALLKSPFAPLLQYTSDPCDPLHVNHVVRLGPDAGGTWGMAPGDLVVSLRNLNAFAILDRESFRLKRLVRGSFFQQHAVTHLEGSTFLLFDNHGSDGMNGPSRLLKVDLSTGRETTIFPNARTPKFLRDLFTKELGNIDISPNRQRAIGVFSRAGIAVEVRLADGAVLNVFTSLHDVSHLEQSDDTRRTQAAIFFMLGLDYIHPARGGSKE